MDINTAIDHVLLGESLSSISADKRRDLCVRAGVDPEEEERAFSAEVVEFMRELCRDLGERHAGNTRAAAALVEWVARCNDYDAWDALLSGFKFEGRARLLDRGKTMFPGTLTAHWSS